MGKQKGIDVIYRLIISLYRLLFRPAFFIYYPFYRRHLERRGNYRDGFRERFGEYDEAKLQRLRNFDRPVWIHAVSVGETVGALALIRYWHEMFPDLHFVISTTTSTGQEIARKERCEWLETIYFPLDSTGWIRQALKVINPRLVALFEVEIWPNFIHTVHEAGIPLALINGRVSERSGKGFNRYAVLFRPLFARFSILCLQSEADRERLGALVAAHPNVHICGSIKFDQIRDPAGISPPDILHEVFGKDALILVGASTHAPEEEILVRIFGSLRRKFEHLKLLLVPRHHERRDEVEAILRQQDCEYDLLTRLRDDAARVRPLDILVGDTTGELPALMAAGDIVFMGKSLGDFGTDGGHNIIEPAALAKPVLFGPAMHNFAVVRDLFLDAKAAVQVNSESELETQLQRLLEDPSLREELGKRARELVDRHRGAMERTVRLITPLI